MLDLQNRPNGPPRPVDSSKLSPQHHVLRTESGLDRQHVRGCRQRSERPTNVYAVDNSASVTGDSCVLRRHRRQRYIRSRIVR